VDQEAVRADPAKREAEAESELLGVITYSCWLPRSDRRHWLEAWTAITLSQAAILTLLALHRPDGGRTWISVLAVLALMALISGPVIWFTIVRCRAPLRQIEAELLARGERLEQIVTERTSSLVEAERQLLQQEKLASVGQLAAGIAHEINTPIQYVGDNLRALSDCFEDLLAVGKQCNELVELLKSGQPAERAVAALETSIRERDLEYLLEDTPRAISQSLEGVGRVAQIVRAMKDFSHVDHGEVTSVDINHALESTLTVSRNEYKYVADIVTDFGDLPPVRCYASEMNQVFLNLLVNAAHAVADTGVRGTITVRTRLEGEQVVVEIADTGTGIPPEIRHRVFEPFFTTKEVGKGTGQGLTIAHQIVVGRHGGGLRFETEIGRGTTFFIRIPVAGPQTRAAEGSAT
jgi:signal transduction histidine kinase